MTIITFKIVFMICFNKIAVHHKKKIDKKQKYNSDHNFSHFFLTRHKASKNTKASENFQMKTKILLWVTGLSFIPQNN